MYEYKTVVAPKNLESLYMDSYGAFGWEQTSVGNAFVSVDQVSLALKRNRSLKNNIELTKMQTQLEGAFQNLKTIQAESNEVGVAQALTVGVLAALVLGVGMSLCMETDQLALGVIVGLIGLVGCATPYFIYRKIRGRSADRFSLATEEQYDRICHICAQAQAFIQ